MAAFGTTSPVAQVLSGMTGFHPSELIPYGYCNGRYAASGRVPAAEVERPLSVQSGDLRADAERRARCTAIHMRLMCQLLGIGLGIAALTQSADQ